MKEVDEGQEEAARIPNNAALPTCFHSAPRPIEFQSNQIHSNSNRAFALNLLPLLPNVKNGPEISQRPVTFYFGNSGIRENGVRFL